MNIFFKPKSQAGFSMIEVLVAVAILGFGLLALAALQTVIIKSSSESKAQSVAIALAKEKIEFFRRFSDITGYQAIDAGNDTPPVLGGVTYARAWTVDRYVFENDVDNDTILNETNDQAFVKYTTSNVGNTPAGYVSNNEFKVIKVTVSWTDANGASQNVVLDDAIGALSPRDSALIAKTPLLTGPRVIPYQIVDPTGDAMVIPIAIGGGTNSAATNPKPQVVKGKSTVETTFEVLTYAGLQGGTATAQQRVETTVTGCTCKYGAGGTTPGMRPVVWNGYRYAPPVSATAAPLAGPDPAFADLQSSNCTICCRDHQDAVGEKGPAFSPRFVTKNSSTGVITANHPHYADKLTATPVTSGSYKEACRIVRVDGILRVAADLSNDYFGLLATGNGTTALTPFPDSTTEIGTPPVPGGAVKRYQNFVVDYLKGRVVTPSPAASAAKTTYNTVGAPATLAATAPYVLDNPPSIEIDLSDTVGKWLHSRGLYVDYLEDDAVQAITDAKADSFCSSSAENLATCILKRLPFTSINLSEIADWSPLSGPLKVTNNDYSTSLAQSYPVRGKVTSCNKTPVADINASSLSRKYNSSLLDLLFDAISPDDDVKYTDSQVFSIINNGTPPTSCSPFSLLVGYSGTNAVAASTIVAGDQFSVSCGLNSTNKFVCEATGGVGSGGGLNIELNNYNHSQVTASNTTPLTGCTGLNGLKSYTGASGQVAPTGLVCKNYAVTSVVFGQSSVGSANAPIASYTNEGNLAEKATISLTGSTGTISPPLAWAANTSYAVGEFVMYNNLSYKASSAHTSGNNFQANNWTETPIVTVNFGTAIETNQVASPNTCKYTCDTATCATNGNNKIRFFVTYPACP